MGYNFHRYWWIWAACVRQFRIHETLTWDELTTMATQLKLGNLDAPWLLGGGLMECYPSGATARPSTGWNAYCDLQNYPHPVKTPAHRNRKQTQKGRPPRP